MTTNQPRFPRDALGQQRAAGRRGAPGKRFVGDTAEQSLNDRRAQAERVGKMAERHAAELRAEALEEPLTGLVIALVEDSFRLARTLATAPLRIGLALLRPREA